MNWTNLYTRFQLLRQIPIFSVCNWLELYFVAERIELVAYNKGEIVYRKGDPCDAFYGVIAGRLVAYDHDAKGHRENVDYIYRGMYFGIVSLLTGEPHSLSFEVLNDATLLRIEKEKFQEMLKRIPRLGLEMSYSLSRRLKRQEHHQKLVFESTIISVYSPSHRTGSTFYAFSLAQQLYRESRKKVIFVHVARSPQDHSCTEAGAQSSLSWKKPATSFRQLANNEYALREAIIKTGDVDVLYMCFDPQEHDLSGSISHFVSTLANDYHYMILDLPNQADHLVVKTLTQSDECHLIFGGPAEELEKGQEIIAALVNGVEHSRAHQGRLRVFIRESSSSSEDHKAAQKVFGAQALEQLPFVESDQLTKMYTSFALDARIPDEDTPFYQTLRRLTREIAKVQIGLALGGGAAFGLSLIGVLRVLEKERIPIDFVTGSSIGALIGALWSLGYTADQIADFAREFRSKLRCLRLLDVVFPHSGLIAGNAIVRWLRAKIGNQSFLDVKIPLRIVAFDILRHEEIIIESGDVVDAIRQSIAIPGFLRPVKQKGRVIIDGGMANPLPVNVCLSYGVSQVIAVNVMKSPEDVLRDAQVFADNERRQAQIRFREHPRQYLLHKIQSWACRLWSPNIFDIIVRNFLSMCSVLAEQSAQQADVVIHPDLEGVDWYELYKVDTLITQGEQATLQKIEEIRALIDR